MTPPTPSTARLDRARADLDAATRRAREARIAATPALRERARRRSRLVRTLILVAACLAAALLLARIVLAVVGNSYDADRRTQDTVLADTETAVTALLTSDPARPQAYLDRGLSVTVGAMHQRLEASRAAVIDAISAQPAPSSGEVLSAGLVTDPANDDEGSTARVLVVAQASDPRLLGADTATGPLTLTVVMVRTDEGWRMSQAEQS